MWLCVCSPYSDSEKGNPERSCSEILTELEVQTAADSAFGSGTHMKKDTKQKKMMALPRH